MTRVLLFVWLLVAIGLVSLFVPATARALVAGWPAGLLVLGAGLFLAGASTVAGSLAGFLFGVPRYRRQDREGEMRSNGDPATAPNTNLEQISDWLTKIIIGVGLTQIPAIGAFFWRLGDEWGDSFANPPAGKLIVVSLTVHYLVMGFFQGFLISSLWLPIAMEDARKEIADLASHSPSTRGSVVEGVPASVD